jgi:2-polyprenyl-3-methyl-5-hydroxy-6-metoxy-1,4-benzoquinol methylase
MVWIEAVARSQNPSHPDDCFYVFVSRAMRSAMILRELAATGLHAWLLARVQALPNISTESRVLDLGCGTGAWLQRLSDSGFKDLTGIDQKSDDFAAKARFVCANLDRTDQVELGSYDLVTAIEIIEHVANPEALIALAAAHLEPDGWLVVTTPNIYSIRWRTRFFLTGKQQGFDINYDPEHIHPMMLYAAQRVIFRRHNLEVARLLTYPENGGNGSRWFARLAERGLSLILPNDLPGDTLCLFLRKRR